MGVPPLEPHVLVIGQHKAHRPADMRHRAQQDLALDQRLAYQTDLEIFKVTQPAVKQLGRGRGCRRGKVVHLGQPHRKAAPRSVPRDAAAIDAAADDKEIVDVLRLRTAHLVLPYAALRLNMKLRQITRQRKVFFSVFFVMRFSYDLQGVGTSGFCTRPAGRRWPVGDSRPGRTPAPARRRPPGAGRGSFDARLVFDYFHSNAFRGAFGLASREPPCRRPFAIPRFSTSPAVMAW